ncbi:hypothetical protein TNCV_3678591 [Trichonephila clavipes]|nr:hypothetical protein TNCV_3678591 [Trichonephila clavipes]
MDIPQEKGTNVLLTSKQRKMWFRMMCTYPVWEKSMPKMVQTIDDNSHTSDYERESIKMSNLDGKKKLQIYEKGLNLRAMDDVGGPVEGERSASPGSYVWRGYTNTGLVKFSR